MKRWKRETRKLIEVPNQECIITKQKMHLDTKGEGKLQVFGDIGSEKHKKWGNKRTIRK